MTKEKFLKHFDEEYNFLASGIYEDIELAREIDYIVFSKFFFPPFIWKTLENFKGDLGVEIIPKGLREDSEKKMLGFYPKDFEDQIYFPTVTFKIDCKNRFKNLEHKDFLGSIMSIGIKRELMGDLIVEENVCYGIATEEIFDIIREKLEYVGKIPADISLIEEKDIPQSKFQEIRETVASLRIDALVSAMLNLSRSLSEKLIESGEVMVDYLVEKKCSRIIEERAVITVRKKGKFLLEKIQGENKKGKTVIIFKKYI